MDSMNASDIIPGPSIADDSTRKSQANEAVSPADEVSNEIKTYNLIKSEGKNSKQPAKEGKLSLKRKEPTKEKLSTKRKKANSILTSQMVTESIKALRKRNGASVEAILEYMEGKYDVDAKLVKRYVTRYLQSAVEKGIVEQLSGTGDDGRFKIKKVEKIANVEQKLKGNQKMAKAEKVVKVGQKLNDKQKKIKAEKEAKVEQKPNQKKAKEEKIAKVEQKLKGNQKMSKAEKAAKVGQKLNDNRKKIKAEKEAKVEKKPNQKKAKEEEVAKV